MGRQRLDKPLRGGDSLDVGAFVIIEQAGGCFLNCRDQMRMAMADVCDEHATGPVEILVAIDVGDDTALGMIPDDRRLEADDIGFKLMPAVEQRLAFRPR